MNYDLNTMTQDEKNNLLKKLSNKRLMILIVGIIGYLFLNVIRSSATIILPTVIDKYALTAAQAGLFIAIYNYMYAIVNLPIGGIIDVVKSRKIMLISYSAMTIGLIGFAFAPNFKWVIITRAIMGFGAAGFFPAYSKSVATWVSEKAHPTVVGIIMAASVVGMLIASTPLTLLIIGVGMTKAMLILAGACLIIFAIMLFVIRDDPHSCGFPTEDEIKGNVIPNQTENEKPKFKEIIKILTNFKIIAVVCGVVCSNVAAVATGYMTTWMVKGLGFSTVTASTVIMVGTLVGIISPLLTGVIANKFGVKATQWVYVTGCIASLLLFSIFLQKLTPVTVVLCNIPSILCAGMAISSTQSILRKNVGPKFLASCVGFYNFVGWAVAQGLYSQIFAKFIDAEYSIQSFNKGYWITFIIAAVFGFVALIGSSDRRLPEYQES